MRVVSWLPWLLASAVLLAGAGLADRDGGAASDATAGTPVGMAESRAERIADRTPHGVAVPRPSDRMPDLQVLTPSDLYVVDDRPQGGALRLKFTTVIWNAGEGPMEVWGDPSEDGTALRVEQVVHDANDRKRPVGPVGSFDFEHRHGHLHLTAFARYELWSLVDGEVDARVAANDKVGFCLMDNLRVDEAVAADEPAYAGCEADVQGISPGWGDEYVAQLYEQDLVIDGLPDGRYRLVNVANPDGTLLEARLDNNAAHVDVVLRDGAVAVATGP